MKTIANRFFVLAASAVAFGTVAFGQVKLTADIPFAFHTAVGSLPAGKYEFNRSTGAGGASTVMIRSTATWKSYFVGNGNRNDFVRATNSPNIEFVCGKNDCTLRAVRTGQGSIEYAAPRKSKDPEKSLAVISIPLKTLSTD